MVGFNLKVANSVREKGGQWGLALLCKHCMEFMTPDQFIKEISGVMHDLWIIVHGSIIPPKKSFNPVPIELPMGPMGPMGTNAVPIKSKSPVRSASR